MANVDRAQIVPGPKPGDETDAVTAQTGLGSSAGTVFPFELGVCERYGGHVKIVAALTDPGSIRREGVGLPARAPPIAAARPHPQQQFDMEYSGSAA
ncbi:MAG: hypothetical protein QF689_18550 [Candidatus Latescibacteria bacterium]|nr:hypothetical protein [Candidatus Latescibacterota bacterium]